MSTTGRFLSRMILFLLAVGAGVAYGYEPLWRAFSANIALNGLIAAVFAIGAILNMRQVIRLRADIRWLDSFRNAPDDALEGLRATDGVIANSPRPVPDPILLSPMSKMLAERTGRGKRLTLSTAAMQALLDGIAGRLEDSRALARYFTGLCIFLGLLGTFWGLLETVASIGDVIRNLTVTSEDIAVVFANLKAGLDSPLAGMGTAFSSSLFGLGGSLVLGFLDLQAGQAQNRFYAELEEWLSGVTRLSSGALGDGEQGVSAYTEALLEQTAEGLNDLRKTLAQAEETRIATSTEFNAVNEKLASLVDHMSTEQKVLLRLAENQKDLKEVLGRLAGGLGDGLPAASGGGFDEQSREYLKSMDAALSRLAQEATAGRTQAVRELREEIKLLAKTIAHTRPASSRDAASRDDL